MGQILRKSTEAKVGPNDSRQNPDFLELKFQQKTLRKSLLKRNLLETQLTIMGEFKASRKKVKKIGHLRLLNDPQKPSLATELYLESLQEKQIPLNILEVPIESPRGIKKFQYDRTKLEKGDFVNFTLVDVIEEEEEEPEKLDAFSYDNKLLPTLPIQDGRQSVTNPHRDSFSSPPKVDEGYKSPRENNTPKNPDENPFLNQQDDTEGIPHVETRYDIETFNPDAQFHANFDDQTPINPPHNRSLIERSMDYTPGSDYNKAPSLFGRRDTALNKPRAQGLNRKSEEASPRQPLRHMVSSFTAQVNNVIDDDRGNESRSYQMNENNDLTKIEQAMRNPEDQQDDDEGDNNYSSTHQLGNNEEEQNFVVKPLSHYPNTNFNPDSNGDSNADSDIYPNTNLNSNPNPNPSFNLNPNTNISPNPNANSSPLEANMGAEVKKRLRIIQLIHDEPLDPSMHMQMIRDRKKIIVESDEENDDANQAVVEALRFTSFGKETPGDSGVESGYPSPGYMNQKTAKSKQKYTQETSLIFNFSSPRNSQQFTPIDLQIHSKVSPTIATAGNFRGNQEKRDPVIKLAQDEEEEERRVSPSKGKYAQQNSPTLRKSKLARLGTSRFSMFVGPQGS